MVDPSLPDIVNKVESFLVNGLIFLLNIMRSDCSVEYGVSWLVRIIISDGGVT